MQCDQKEEIPSRFGKAMDKLFISSLHLDFMAYEC
jgi:hypothetical protein